MSNNKIRQNYHKFIEFIHNYFDNNVMINIYFEKNQCFLERSRNYLANKINFIENPLNQKLQNNILNQYHNEIVVSFFDSDDITHPQKYEIMDKIFSKQHINGSILHQLSFLNCKETNAYFWWQPKNWKKERNFKLKEKSEFDEYLNHSQHVSNDDVFVYRFHEKQIRKLSLLYKFEMYTDTNITNYDEILIELSRV